MPATGFRPILDPPEPHPGAIGPSERPMGPEGRTEGTRVEQCPAACVRDRVARKDCPIRPGGPRKANKVSLLEEIRSSNCHDLR